MNVHKNARLTPRGRALMVSRIVTEGCSVAETAQAFGVSERTVHKWLGRYRRGPSEDFTDRSSAPRRCPRRTSPRRITEIERLRRRRMSGAQIATALGMPRSTVGLLLRRLGLGRLAMLEPRAPVVRYERAAPGELIHIDIKTLGKIDGVGHRITGQHERHTGRGGSATSTCTWPSMTPRAWPTQKSCPAWARRTPPPSSSGRWPGTPGWG